MNMFLQVEDALICLFPSLALVSFIIAFIAIIEVVCGIFLPRDLKTREAEEALRRYRKNRDLMVL